LLPTACAADACVYGEPFSQDDLGLWATLWNLDDARTPALILLAQAHDCSSKGMAVGGDELGNYVLAGGPLGEFGAPKEFTLERYKIYVNNKLGLTLKRY
jgi:hypothetical protein